jgi:hypothetical protein
MRGSVIRFQTASILGSGDRSPVDLLESVDGAPEVVAIHAADLAARKMGPIEQRFGLGDKRRIFVVRATWRSTVDRRRGDRGYGRDGLPTALAADAGRLTARMAANTRNTR